MKLYICEFRPINIDKLNLFWKLGYKLIGTGYYHTGMVIGDTYYELVVEGYRSFPFTTFHELIEKRAHPRHDTMDIIEIPHEFTEEEIQKCKAWWDQKIKDHVGYGWIRVISVLFYKTLRQLSNYYYKATGHVLQFAKTDAERSIRICSSAVDECPKDAVSYDLFPEYDEAITIPGLSVEKYGIMIKGT